MLQPTRQANFRAVYLTSFMFYVLILNIFLSLCFVLSNNCQMFKCQVSFSKVFLSMSKKHVFTGSHLNAANFYLTMLFCYTILRLKLDVPWCHVDEKKLYSSWYPKIFHGFSLIIVSKFGPCILSQSWYSKF